LDLHLAAKRYEEMRNFWAREIALTLARGYYKTQVALLRKLADHGQPMRADRARAALPTPYANEHSRETAGTGFLLNLLRSGLVTRVKMERAYWYTITELGALVLMYLPATTMGETEKNTSATTMGETEKNTSATTMSSGRKKRGRPRKMPALEAQSV
jgi:hypothetical protein